MTYFPITCGVCGAVQEEDLTTSDCYKDWVVLKLNHPLEGVVKYRTVHTYFCCPDCTHEPLPLRSWYT